MKRSISDSVVVITGASSGIGRATARELARRGAGLVLAARRGELLEEAAEECRALGTEAIAVQADVTEERDVEALADRAVTEFGRVDVWINDAGIGVSGRFEDTPSEVDKRVIETNLFGTMHGSRAAIKLFRGQEGGGHLINIASVLGTTGSPYMSAYAASKFAVRGFTESLRIELRGSGIDVTCVMPGAIDTPFFQHSANYSGKELRPPQPVYAPERVALAIAGCIERPRAEVFVGGGARAIWALRSLLGRGYDPISLAMTRSEHFEEKPVGPTTGIAYEPSDDAMTARGGWGAGTPRTGKTGWLILGAAAAGLTVWALAQRKQERQGSRAAGRNAETISSS